MIEINYESFIDDSAKSAFADLVIDAMIKHDGDIYKVATEVGRQPHDVEAVMQYEGNRKRLCIRASKYKNASFNSTKDSRLSFLWDVAQAGAERIYDKEGNHVMMNGAVAVSAVRAMNDMIAGSYAPKEVEITHTSDTRTESEIRANIKRLTAEYNNLAVIEGVAESDIAQVDSLPAGSDNDGEKI